MMRKNFENAHNWWHFFYLVNYKNNVDWMYKFYVTWTQVRFKLLLEVSYSLKKFTIFYFDVSQKIVMKSISGRYGQNLHPYLAEDNGNELLILQKIIENQKTAHQEFNHHLRILSLRKRGENRPDLEEYRYSILDKNNNFSYPGITPFRNVSFKDELPKMRASCTLPDHFTWWRQNIDKNNLQLLDSSVYGFLSIDKITSSLL